MFCSASNFGPIPGENYDRVPRQGVPIAQQPARYGSSLSQLFSWNVGARHAKNKQTLKTLGFIKEVSAQRIRGNGSKNITKTNVFENHPLHSQPESIFEVQIIKNS